MSEFPKYPPQAEKGFDVFHGLLLTFLFIAVVGGIVVWAATL